MTLYNLYNKMSTYVDSYLDVLTSFEPISVSLKINYGAGLCTF